MRVLVTHPASNVGTLLVEDLRQRGHEVVAMYDRPADRRPARPRLAGGRADPRSSHEFAHVLRRARPEAVMHLMPPGLDAPVFDDPRGTASCYDGMHVARTAQLLEAAAAHGVSRLVLASSWAVYGMPQVSPIDERALPRPTTLAAETVLACERLTLAHSRATGTGCAVLRCFTSAGVDNQSQSAQVFRRDGLVDRAVRAARTGDRLTIHGTDFPTADGTAIRDYVHVTDVVRAYVTALERCGGHWGVWNVGSGRPTSDLDVIREVEFVTRRPIVVTSCPSPRSVPAVGVADTAAITAALGWKPRRGLPEIVRSVVEHYGDRFETGQK